MNWLYHLEEMKNKSYLPDNFISKHRKKEEEEKDCVKYKKF
jgi:hypothetical protein